VPPLNGRHPSCRRAPPRHPCPGCDPPRQTFPRGHAP
jgi:hypothetical protein